MNLKPRSHEEPEINVVSLIDVVLLLVVFFILSSRFTDEGRLHVHLPTASAVPQAKNNEQAGLVVSVYSAAALLEEATWYFPSRDLNNMAYSEAHSSPAVRTMASRTGSISVGVFEMIRSTSAVAVCCSSASCNSRLSWVTSVSAPVRDGRLPATFGGLCRFDFDDLGRRDLAGLPLALEWRLIASPVPDTAW